MCVLADNCPLLMITLHYVIVLADNPPLLTLSLQCIILCQQKSHRCWRAPRQPCPLTTSSALATSNSWPTTSSMTMSTWVHPPPWSSPHWPSAPFSLSPSRSRASTVARLSAQLAQARRRLSGTWPRFVSCWVDWDWEPDVWPRIFSC